MKKVDYEFQKSDFAEDYHKAYDAFRYEIANHEWINNWHAVWDVLSCFGLNDDVCEYDECKDAADYMDAMGFTDTQKRAFNDALSDYYMECKANGYW